MSTDGGQYRGIGDAEFAPSEVSCRPNRARPSIYVFRDKKLGMTDRNGAEQCFHGALLEKYAGQRRYAAGRDSFE